MKIYDEIIKALKARGIKQNLTKNTNFKDIGLDSLDLMDMVVRMEKELKIQIPDDELMSMKTIGDLVTVVEKLMR